MESVLDHVFEMLNLLTLKVIVPLGFFACVLII